MSTWLPAREYFNSGRDPLRGKRRALAARHVNSVSEHILDLMPTAEIEAALGGDAKANDIATGKARDHAVLRVRADYIGFLKALAARYEANTGEVISLPNVTSLVALHGMKGAAALPEFQPVDN